MTATTLFISRAGADADIAAEIGRILKADGYDVILQQWESVRGGSFVEMMNAGLVDSVRVVALLSADYLASDFCAAEWQGALAGDPLDRRNRLIVLRVAGCDPPGLLGALPSWDLVSLANEPAVFAEVVRRAVRDASPYVSDPVAGPYWRTPQTVINAEAIRETRSFTGRDALLHDIDSALWNGGTVALYGLGGAGKSAAAREYARRNASRYAVVWRLVASSEAGVVDGLVRLGSRFVPALDEALDRPAAAMQVVTKILTGFDKPVLLIFDGLIDEELMLAWRPAADAHVLATSRNAAWSSDVTAISVSGLSPDEATDYLLHECVREDLTREDAHGLAQMLGRLPLALAHAAAYLRRTRNVTVQRYLARIFEHLADAAKGTDYDRAVFATFRESIVQAEQEAPGAAAVVCFAAFFSPEAIPEELGHQKLEVYLEDLRPVLDAGRIPPRDLRSTVAATAGVDEALGALDRLSIIVFAADTRTFTMHGLVQIVALELLDGALPIWSLSAVAAVDAAFPESRFENWNACDRLVPHARSALAAVPEGAPYRHASHLANECGAYLFARALYADAEAFYRHAIAIDDVSLGPGDPERAAVLSNLGELFRTVGRFGEAESLLLRALQMDEIGLGADHPRIATDLNNLALLMHDTNRIHDAEELTRRALGIMERAYGHGHGNVAMTLNNLSGILAAQRRFAEAEPLARRALAIHEALFGPVHPDLVTDLNNLAGYVHALKRYDEALPMYQRALAVAERTYGATHPAIAACLGNMANLFSELGDLAAAESLCVRSLEMHEKVYGPNHPAVALGLFNLAESSIQTGRDTEAEALYRRALAIDEAAYESDDPNLLTVQHGLANLLDKAGRYAEAEALLRPAAAAALASGGAPHAIVPKLLGQFADTLSRRPDGLAEAEDCARRALALVDADPSSQRSDVTAALHRLGRLLVSRDRAAAAEPLYRRLLSVVEADGPESLDVAAGSIALAAVRRTLGDAAEAERLYRRALAIMDATPAAPEPGIAQVLANLADLAVESERFPEAETLYRRLLALNERIHGESDATVAASLNDLGRALAATGRNIDAETVFRRALTIIENNEGPDDPEAAICVSNIASVLDDMGRSAEAESLFRRALAIAQSSSSPDDPDVVTHREKLANLLVAQGRIDDTIALYRHALELAEACYGRQNPKTAPFVETLAALLRASDRAAEAEPLLREVLAFHEAALGAAHPTVMRDLAIIAHDLRSMNRRGEAEVFQRRILEIDEARFGPDHMAVARDLDSVAQLLIGTERQAEAEPLVRRALAIVERNCEPDDPSLVNALTNLAMLIAAHGQLAEAEALLVRALGLLEARLGPGDPNVTPVREYLASVRHARGS